MATQKILVLLFPVRIGVDQLTFKTMFTTIYFITLLIYALAYIVALQNDELKKELGILLINPYFILTFIPIINTLLLLYSIYLIYVESD